MTATYELTTDELTIDFLESVRKTFEGKNIGISVFELDDTAYLFSSQKNMEILQTRIDDIENGRNLVIPDQQDFE